MNGIPETKKSESARSAKVHGGTRKNQLTQERVRELFDYQRNGIFVYRASRGAMKKGAKPLKRCWPRTG